MIISLMARTIGSVQGDWLSQAKPDIEARMAQYEEGQIEFAILSLVRDPLLDMIPALAENVKAISALSSRLDVINPGWEDLSDSSMKNETVGRNNSRVDAGLTYGITQRMLDQAQPSQAVIDLCHGSKVPEILALYKQLNTAQGNLRMSIREEMQSNQSDEERAAARTCDYGARMQNFVRKMKVKRQASKGS